MKRILVNEWAIGIMLVLLAKICTSCSVMIDDRDQNDNKHCVATKYDDVTRPKGVHDAHRGRRQNRHEIEFSKRNYPPRGMMNQRQYPKRERIKHMGSQ